MPHRCPSCPKAFKTSGARDAHHRASHPEAAGAPPPRGGAARAVARSLEASGVAPGRVRDLMREPSLVEAAASRALAMGADPRVVRQVLGGLRRGRSI